jgi:hypothetical protein
MRIDFIKPLNNSNRAKRITLQKGGKLTFPSRVREELGTAVTDYYKIGLDLDDKSRKILFLLKTTEKEADSVKINKSGLTYFLPISFALQAIGVDFETKKYTVTHSVVVIDKKNFIKLEFAEK